MNSRAIVNITGVLLIYNILIFYIGWNGWYWIHSQFEFEQVALYAVAIIFLSYSYFLGRRFSWFKILGSYWMAIIQYAMILLPIADTAAIIMHYIGFPKEKIIFWVGSMTLLSFVAIFAYGSFNAWRPIVRTYEIEIPKKAGHLSHLRIAMASDMHFGILSGKAHLQRLVKKVNEMKADLILLPGDIIDDEPGPFMAKNMDEVMKQMKAPLGVFGVLGNHEYYGRKIPEFVKLMQDIDIKILMDEVVEIGDLYLIGRKDRTDKNRKPLEELLEGMDKTRPIILMDHQPYGLDQAESHGIDVMLSGHTHRGQMAPNHLITKKMYELDWGYIKKNQLHVIVSSGFGFWGPPLRIGSRSEIIQLNIRFVEPC